MIGENMPDTVPTIEPTTMPVDPPSATAATFFREVDSSVFSIAHSTPNAPPQTLPVIEPHNDEIGIYRKSIISPTA